MENHSGPRYHRFHCRLIKKLHRLTSREEKNMLQSVKNLEKELFTIKTDVEIIKSNYATKENVSNAKNSIIMWVVGAIFFAQLIPALPSIINAIKIIFL
ncbi:TPA: hypothetical protein ACPZQZ_001987 [Yersinia enterocolitica]|uniref:hypothetical protein n=1 Tax=Yersinia enterocolitica TaxID=630 RepID=UPI000906F081|nr:hypothetical protein [Yersinia enterocolitica]